MQCVGTFNKIDMNNLKTRLTIMNFLQFAIWGAWLISLGGYMHNQLHFSGFEIGSIYGTMGIASLFMPGLIGIIADKWINAEKLLAICHFLGAGLLYLAADLNTYSTLYPVMLLISIVYMPTIALTNTIAYDAMDRAGMNIVKEFPSIRVWGTVGFIMAMWSIDLLRLAQSPTQLYVSSGISLLLAIYALVALPKCPCAGKNGNVSGEKKSLVTALGLDAFKLFKQRKMAIFFIFAMLLGACLQITNTFGTPFLDSFKTVYPDSFAVKYPVVLLSLSQISETLFILAIPFFMSKFGIKRVMIMSMSAWVLRFAFFGIGDPGMPGFIFLMLSMIVYGMAFDFFNISGSMFVEREAPQSIRASAQGLFMIMTNGIGAIIGGYASGAVVDLFTKDGVTNWSATWFVFAIYSLVICVLFAFLFRYNERPSKAEIKN